MYLLPFLHADEVSIFREALCFAISYPTSLDFSKNHKLKFIVPLLWVERIRLKIDLMSPSLHHKETEVLKKGNDLSLRRRDTECQYAISFRMAM